MNKKVYNKIKLHSTAIWVLILSALSSLNAQNPLFIPDTLSGDTIVLNLQHGSIALVEGVQTASMGANGNILGPTLILHKGQHVQMMVNNQLNQHSTIHWHGMHVAPWNDGSPHTLIHPGMTWMPEFTVLDHASTYWYHPHPHHMTNLQVSLGIAGLIIVRDAEEAALPLPRSYGVDDFPVIIQTKDLDNDGQVVVFSNNDDLLMVNATFDPVLDVPAQVIRLRVLNGSSQRVFNLGMSNGQTMFQIGTDAGLLSGTYATQRIKLSPGERAEILLDLDEMSGTVIHLMSYASELPNGIYGAANPGIGPGMVLTGYHPNPLNGNNFNILQLNIGPATDNPVIGIPSSLVNIEPIPESAAHLTRPFTFDAMNMGPTQLDGHFWINNTPFDIDKVNFTVALNAVEIWEITNHTAIAHPFHMHNVPFYIIDRNGIPPHPGEQGRKDVVLVNAMETVRYITQFTNFSHPDLPYMYHCHMLTHEDDGMMGQFLVLDEGTNIRNANLYADPVIHPNPVQHHFYLHTLDEIAHVSIYDLLGRSISDFRFYRDGNKVEVAGLSTGMYILQLHYIDGRTDTLRFIRQ